MSTIMALEMIPCGCCFLSVGFVLLGGTDHVYTR